jgi:hypothetical protein
VWNLCAGRGGRLFFTLSTQNIFRPFLLYRQPFFLFCSFLKGTAAKARILTIPSYVANRDFEFLKFGSKLAEIGEDFIHLADKANMQNSFFYEV